MTTADQCCDLCGSTTGVQWEWQTPNAYANSKDAEVNDGIFFEDEGWYICDTCHRLVLGNRWPQLLERAEMRSRGQILASMDGDGLLNLVDVDLDEVQRVHEAFRMHKTTYRKLL